MISRRNKIIFISVTFFLYFLSGFYIVSNGENALIMRFGSVSSSAVSSGVHYHLPYPFEEIKKFHVSRVTSITVESEGRRIDYLTGDENLISIKTNVNYDIKDLQNYLFNIKDSFDVIRNVTRMCLSHELAFQNIDEVMTKGKSVFRLVLKEKVQKVLDELDSGIRLISVDLTEISPPKYVSPAFKAVSNAREKKQEIVKEAEGYANSVIPKARGNSESLLEGARAYSREKINTAQGKAETFKKMVREYYRNPSVVKNQKYYESLKKIFGKAKVSVDSKPGKTILYIK